jgi:hypothetical protein
MPVKITFDNVTESLSVMSDTLKKLDGRSVKVGVLGSANSEVLALLLLMNTVQLLHLKRENGWLYH